MTNRDLFGMMVFFVTQTQRFKERRCPPRIGDEVGSRIESPGGVVWYTIGRGGYWKRVYTTQPGPNNLSITMKSQLSKPKNRQELPWRFQIWEGGPPHLSGRFFLITSEGSDDQKGGFRDPNFIWKGGSFQRKMPSWATEKLDRVVD